MTASPTTAARTPGAPGTPRLYRRPDHALLGGVAAGIAEHLHVPKRVVRWVFVGFAVAGGLGVALYAAYWIVVPARPGAAPGRLPRWLEYLLAFVAVGVAVGAAVKGLPSGGAIFVPVLFACIGGALIWRQASEPERVRLLRLSRTSLEAGGSDRIGRVRLVAGIVLVIAGAVFVLAKADVTAIRDGLIAMVVTVVGVALLTGPWWMRTVTQLSEERAERIRTQERADLAAHLHDSVLQTLALIQRKSDSPREVARLARGQERELRAMLYRTPAASGLFADQLRSLAGEVEDAYAVKVDVVVVSDAEMDERLNAVAAAAREALVNAAKHAGVTAVSLYAELEPDEVSVFVKDRGSGFEMEDVADDRQGVRGSIIGRVERHGGTAQVTSSPGVGTEIEIRMPRS